MPTDMMEGGPAYYRALERARARVTAELVGKGMKPGHGKFDKVMREKLQKRRFWD